MNKLNFSIILMCITILASAQTKITGFGKLKLDQTTEIIREANRKIVPISDYSEYISKVYKNTRSTNIFELICDSTSKSPLSEASLDHRVKVFYFPNYSITDNIDITGVTLKFFRDSLYEINCDSNDKLIEALTLKYGAPEVTVKKEDHEFTFVHTGNKITKTDETYTSKWNTNDSHISCISVLMDWFSSDGKENFLSYVNLNNNTHRKDIENIETIIKERIANRELLQKKKSISDF